MYQNDWQELIENEVELLASLPREIAASWKKCYQKNVDPLMNQPRKILSLSELQEKQEQHHLLIDLVEKEVSCWTDMETVLQPLYILTDCEGAILWRNGSYQLKDYANQISFKEGSCWTEQDVGTNAIGLALTIKKQVFVGMKEHYAYASKNWSCAASPIFNEQDEVIGILNVSTYQNETAKDSLKSIKVVTERISNQLLKMKLTQKMKLLQLINQISQKGIICDTDFKAVHVSVDYQRSFQLNDDMREFIDKNKVYESQKINFDDEVIGYLYLPTREQEFSQNFGIESQDSTYQKWLKQTIKYAKSPLPIHIYGESGSGKEIIAKTIHQHSEYREGEMVSLNCGAFSEQLLESELFGYAPGAFTGALSDGYQGKIEQANGGTLFLDEIDSMSPRMQQVLLRVLEDKVVTPIGGKEKQVDFRIVTASNKALNQQVQQQLFREDLFYRLVVCHVEIPPLRERPQDLNVLLVDFCQQKNWSINWLDKLTNVIEQHQWPGNIREFRNFLERLYLTYEEETPTTADLWKLLLVGSIQGDLETTIVDEKQQIEEALKVSNYHLINTASLLGISRTTLYRKMKKYNINS
ncbi:sigma-54-dependent Fis family transcriptional regulator [Vagococcus fluvialis]|uniref:sigma-54-dependent Fis family transcriptional regulator n=1 Tax=Vagococcus fluvialis TaxID=2738 RepID=UPI003B591581